MLDDKPAGFGGYQDGSEELRTRTESSEGATFRVSVLGLPSGGSRRIAQDHPMIVDHLHAPDPTRNTIDRAVERFAPHPLRD